MNPSLNHRWPLRRSLKTALAALAAFSGLMLASAVIAQGPPPPPPAPPPIPPVPVPPQNPITEAKRALGKILFWDEQLSTSNSMSCGSCHTPNRAGTDARIATNPGFDNLLGTPDDIQGSPGIIASNSVDAYLRDSVFGLAPQVTNRTSMSPINAAFVPNAFWDGRAGGTFTDPETGIVRIPGGGALESQAVAPLLNNVEMAHAGFDWSQLKSKLVTLQPLALATSIPSDLNQSILGRPTYPELFRRAFGDGTITATRIAFALATYQRTLISNQSPFDNFIAGIPGALTQNQLNGWGAFNASNCTACHAGPLLTGQGFRNVGLRPSIEDIGRQAVTNDPNDRGRMKVPSLRNVGLKRTFMHNGQFTTLAQVIAFYARAPGAAPQFAQDRDPVMATVNVPPQAAGLIQDLLQNAMTDPRVANQTFPFDKPTLFAERPTDRITSQGGGLAGADGRLARIISLSPPLLGNADFRLGLDSSAAHSGKIATLLISPSAPVAGLLTGATTQGTAVIDSAGVATVKWSLTSGSFSAGQQLFAQFRYDDTTAVGGQAFSDAVLIRFFCSSQGCPAKCDADINADQQITVQDIFTFLNHWFAGDLRADKTGDNVVSVQDIFTFLAEWFTGC